MGGFKLTGLGAATVNGDAVRYQEAVLAGADAKITSMTALTAPTVAANPMRATDIQAQLVTAFTTAGTSTAFTLTPTPAITANTTNQRFRVKFNAASGATPTLAVSGQTAKNLKYYDSTGTKQSITSTQVPINWIADVEFDGTDWVVLNVPPAAVVSSAQIQPISASVGSNALTISASALSLDFRSTTLGSGTVTTVSGTPANLVISSGSTLGTVSATRSRIAVLAMNNAGTIELAAVNVAGLNDLSETNVISTTAEGGAGGADSVNVIYSTTARSNLAYRVIGYIESTQATAGTWASAPSTIQGIGGRAMMPPGITLSVPVASTSGTSIDFTGIPSTAKRITINFNGVSTSGTSHPLFQIGDSGGIETTGYLGSGSDITTVTTYTTGFGIPSGQAANVLHGSIVLSLMNSANNTWAAHGIFGQTTNNNVNQTAGVKSTSATLDRVRITTVGGSDTFDAGEINISYE